MIWAHLGNTGTTDKAEMALDMKEQLMSRKLSKLICYHNSEWGADYSSLESEVTAYFDKIIDEADSNVKEDLETKKTAALDVLKPKVISLDFWSKVKIANNDKEGMPLDMITDPFENVSRQRSPWEMDSIPPDDEKDKQSLVPFPTSAKVYHFHPIAFVEQMRMIEKDQLPKFPITVNQLELIFPNSTEIRRREVEKAINKYSTEFEIDDINRMSHFLGQIGTETGQLMQLKENYNYSAETIYNIFLRKVLVKHPTESDKYTFKYHDLIEGYNATLECEYSSPTSGYQKNYGHESDVQNPIVVTKIGTKASWSYADFMACLVWPLASSTPNQKITF